MTLHIALYQPEIPQNTGNIIRLCANAGAQLHLIHPMGFKLEDSKLRRAGLDYHEFTSIEQYTDFPHFLAKMGSKRIFACSTKGTQLYTTPQYQTEDVLLFGPETRGLPENILASLNTANIVRIPMRPHSRSLNLSNAVAVITYEICRQQGFSDLS